MPAAPSLLIVPYRSKTGKLYSQIPTSGAGDFTVTRNTEARRVNSAGLIESVASGIPRLDYYTSGGTAGCPALLVEPAATNLALQSEGFSVSGTWVPEGTNPTQVTANSTGTLDPAGGNTADIITLVSGSANQLRQSFVSTSGTTYTISVFLKNIALTSGQTFLFSTTNQEATINQVNCTIDLANLTITAVTVGTGVTVSNAALDNYGNGWYRARFTFSFAVGGTNSYIRLRQPNNVGTNYAFYAWGAQIETGSVATSYIPTTTAAVTRNADVISVSGAVSGSIGQTEGTIYAEVDLRNLGVVGSIVCVQTASFISGTVRIQLQASNQLFVSISDASGTTQYSNTISSHTLSAGINKIALGYSSVASGFVTALNGSIIETATVTASFGTLGANRVYLGARESSGSFSLFFNNRIRAVALYTTRLTNAELQSLTTL